MGTNPLSEQLASYGKADHPIHGQIQAYYLKNETGKFVMKIIQSLTPAQLQLIETVSLENHRTILTCYGNEAKIEYKNKGETEEKHLERVKSKKELESTSHTKISKEKPQDVAFYWEYLNWDLAMETEHLKNRNEFLKEETLWEIIDVLLEASIFFKQHDVYLDIRPKTIQFTAGRQPKLYWLDILPNNLHLPYERYINLGEFRHTIYSPEELLEMCRVERQEINKDKSILFKIGLCLLESITHKDIRSIYNYNARLISEVKKREFVALCKGKYSQEFESVLNGILQYFPKDRLGFEELQAKLDKHYGRDFKGINLVFDSRVKENEVVEEGPNLTVAEKRSKKEQETPSTSNLNSCNTSENNGNGGLNLMGKENGNRLREDEGIKNERKGSTEKKKLIRNKLALPEE